MSSKIDDLIREALSEEQREIFARTDELGWFQLGLSQFHGKNGWVVWLIVVMQTVMFLAAIWCGYNFLVATEVLTALKWGLPAATLLILSQVLKMSLMPQMQADRVLRELKRVELMIAQDREL